MTPAQWDSTTVLIRAGAARRALRASRGGRSRSTGTSGSRACPTSDSELNLPKLDEGRALHPFAIEPAQRFTSPPGRYTEAS